MSKRLMAQVAQCSKFAVPPYIGALNSSCQIEGPPKVVHLTVYVWWPILMVDVQN
jgi:hypothetical protein